MRTKYANCPVIIIIHDWFVYLSGECSLLCFLNFPVLLSYPTLMSPNTYCRLHWESKTCDFCSRFLTSWDCLLWETNIRHCLYYEHFRHLPWECNVLLQDRNFHCLLWESGCYWRVSNKSLLSHQIPNVGRFIYFFMEWRGAVFNVSLWSLVL